MQARPATVGDLEFVFRDLSKRIAEEYAAAGKDRKAAHDSLMMNMREGRAYALVQNDHTVAIIAWHEDDGSVDTLFAAKDEFFSASTVRFCKRHIRRVQAVAGNLPIRSRIWFDRPEIRRWFRILGFVETGRENAAWVFELAPARE